MNRYRATNLGHVIDQQGRFRQWVAERANVSPSLITRLIAGKRTVTEGTANRIAEALGVPLHLIFELSSSTVVYPSVDVEREVAVA